MFCITVFDPPVATVQPRSTDPFWFNTLQKFLGIHVNILNRKYLVWFSMLHPTFSNYCNQVWKLGNTLVHKHWTQDVRTKDQRTRGLGTQGPGTQSSSSVAFSFYDRNASCVNVLSSNIWLYHCGLQSLHCCTHSRRSSHQIAISHYLLAFFIYSLLCKPKNSSSI